jgi:hypothetical protein
VPGFSSGASILRGIEAIGVLMDMVFLGVFIALFALASALVKGCAVLERKSERKK